LKRRQFLNSILASASLFTPFSRLNAEGQPLILGIFLRRNIKTTHNLFTPMAEYLSQKLDRDVKLKIAK
jgi:ABC-type phosphate/phosphonate transport system substrate-binding protein